MPLDPDILKLRWGIAPDDHSKDTLVGQVAAEAQALAETYTGRRFDLDDDQEDFERVNYSLQVRRYPIESITAMFPWAIGQVPNDPAPGGGVGPYRIDKAKGLIWPGNRGWADGRVLRVEYRGGFDPWPVDLNWAITQAADILWADTPGGGAAAGSGGGTSLGQVKKLSVVGVYSVEVGSDSSAGADAGQSETWGVLTPPITAVLDRYRIAAVVGIG